MKEGNAENTEIGISNEKIDEQNFFDVIYIFENKERK